MEEFTKGKQVLFNELTKMQRDRDKINMETITQRNSSTLVEVKCPFKAIGSPATDGIKVRYITCFNVDLIYLNKKT